MSDATYVERFIDHLGGLAFGTSLSVGVLVIGFATYSYLGQAAALAVAASYTLILGLDQWQGDSETFLSAFLFSISLGVLSQMLPLADLYGTNGFLASLVAASLLLFASSRFEKDVDDGDEPVGDEPMAEPEVA